MNVNAVQIGGDHYKTQYQVWDMIEDNHVPYLEGNVIKYVTRWRKKHWWHCQRDLEKARHYVEKMIALYSIGRRNTALVECTPEIMDKFRTSNHLTVEEADVILSILTWQTGQDLFDISNTLWIMIWKYRSLPFWKKWRIR